MRSTLEQLAYRVVVILSAVLGTWTSAEAQRLRWLSGNGENIAYGVSDNGRVVVGYRRFQGIDTAFVWNPIANTLQLLPTLGGRDCRAYGVSPDGRIVVGSAMIPSLQALPVMWVSGTPTALSNNEGTASDAASSGHVVGWYWVSGNARAFLRYPSGSVQDLGDLGGGFAQAYALAVAGGNPVVVGRSFTTNNDLAFRWESGVMQSLGTLGRWSWALGISDNAQVAVGVSWPSSSSNQYAVRWTRSGSTWTLQNLGPVPNGTWSEAHDCNRDGSIVVGRGSNASGYLAFRWSTIAGMEDLNTTYASLLTNGSRLEWATAISADGCYIVGQGYNAAIGRRDAFWLSVCCESHNGDVNENGCVDDGDLLRVLFAFGSTGQNLGRVDVNCDQVVDDGDLLIVLFNFGQGC